MGYASAGSSLSVAERAKSSGSGGPEKRHQIHEVIIRAVARLLLPVDLEDPVEHARQWSTFPADDFRRVWCYADERT